MNKYIVTVVCTFKETITIEANNQKEAEEQAIEETMSTILDQEPDTECFTFTAQEEK